MEEITDRELEGALIVLILKSLSEIDCFDEVSCYNFDLKITGNRVKGVIKVDFEEVE